MRKNLYILILGVLGLIVGFLLLLNSSRFNYIVHQYKERKLYNSFRETQTYKDTYKAELLKLRENRHRVNDDSIKHVFEEYGGDLLDLILYREYGYAPTEGCHVCGISAKVLAISEANHTYRQEKFGKDYYERAIKKAEQIKSEYKLNELNSVLLSVSKQAFSKSIVDGREVADFNKVYLKHYPLRFAAKPNSEDFTLEENSKTINFTAIRHENDSVTAQLPIVYLKVYMDSTETDYPYSDIPIKVLRLNDWNYNKK